jgi:hypothetical protein
MKFRISNDNEELEAACCVACAPVGQAEYFANDVRTTCARCGRGIHHRPYPLVPVKPPKLCRDCAMNGPEDGTADDSGRYIKRAPQPVARRPRLAT